MILVSASIASMLLFTRLNKLDTNGDNVIDGTDLAYVISNETSKIQNVLNDFGISWGTDFNTNNTWIMYNAIMEKSPFPGMVRWTEISNKTRKTAPYYGNNRLTVPVEINSIDVRMK